MANLLKDLSVTRVSLVNRAAVRDPSNPTEPQRLLLWKHEGAVDPNQGGNMPPTTEELTASLAKAEGERDEHKTALEKAQTDLVAVTAKVADLEKAAAKKQPGEEAGDDEVDLEKADIPAPLKAALLKQQAERDELKKQAEELKKAADEQAELFKAERDIRVTREFIAKAEAFKSLPVNADEFGPVLKSVAEKLTKDEADAIDTLLKAADEQIRASDLFKEQGRGGQPPAADSAIAEVQRKAEELKKADGKLSDEQALAKAMESDRDLQARYLAEIR